MKNILENLAEKYNSLFERCETHGSRLKKQKIILEGELRSINLSEFFPKGYKYHQNIRRGQIKGIEFYYCIRCTEEERKIQNQF